ncbi:hypothetical protein GUJ93_ZPchr0013g36858 [Zizania palustris]|uniref:Speckle-type POZ protein n=1 Tax=Zizania palustris TaxID=103762 RepID=A0A8J6BY01_ZIZPA|nr:hypothetical protein GUJ93_ZPchr0013g36858 [Zizania palustris]
MAADVSSSTIVAEAVSGSHVIRIDGYSRIKELIENGKCVSSIPFSVGGNSWIIRFYPNGRDKQSEDYLSFYLSLDSDCDKDVKAMFSFELLDKNGGPVTLYSRTSLINTFESKGWGWGYNMFMKEMEMEGSAHLRDDSFDIKCEVTVIKEICSKETNKGKQFVVVPPADLHHHLGNLLVNMDGADVTFNVSHERFLAHRCVLAARSSVFRAEFFGSINVKDCRTIRIKDMEADVFRSLLHFIYTDTLPDASQDVHSCPGLKEACFEFLASPSNLERVMASNDFDHLKSSCPSVLMEFMARFLPPEMNALGVVLASACYNADDEKSLKGRKRRSV